MKTTTSLSGKLVRIGAALLIVALLSISLTLWVTWQLSGGAAALNEAGRLRMQVWQLTSTVQMRPALASNQALITQFDHSLHLLTQGDAERPLFVPWNTEVRQNFTRITDLWQNRKNLFRYSPQPEYAPLMLASQQLVEAIDHFVLSIEQRLSQFAAILNLFQFVMMALAIMGAAVMLYISYLYVINPMAHLRKGLHQLESGQFSTRVEVTTHDEFGQVAASFNRMAATLQSLYDTLETQVATKTQRIAAQNERLEALYSVSAFLAQATDLNSLTHGFAERVRRLMKADALLLRWINEEQSKYWVLASDHLPQTMLDEEHCLHAGECKCGNPQQGTRPRVIPITHHEPMPLQHCARLGFESLISIPVQRHQQLLGEMNLFYKQPVSLCVEESELIETLATHLANAVEGLRAVELGRESAITRERTLLARELHDSIAQSLAFLKIQVQLLHTAMQKQDTTLAKQSLAELDHGLEESIANVRELLLHFRTRAQQNDLETAIQETLQKFQHQTGLNVKSQVTGDSLPLAADTQIQVLYVLQEALSNIRKHAHATSVHLNISKGSTWQFTVQDDGIGFDPAEHIPNLRVGMHIMRERASQIGANLEVSSSPNHGTMVRLTLPLPTQAKAA